MNHPNTENMAYAWQAFNHSEYAINITNLTGEILLVNTAYMELYGYDDDAKIIGFRQNAIRWEETDPKVYKDLWSVISQDRIWRGKLINKRVDGELLPVHLSIYPIFEEGKKIGYMGFTLDRSQQFELEKQLLQANRLMILGTLGAGMAHELNNPLTSISLEAENLLDLCQENEIDKRSARESIEVILNGVDRMKRVIDHLLSYVRKGGYNSQDVVSVQELFEDALLFLDRQFRNRNIQITIDQKSPFYILGSRTDLESVLHNLLTNSRDAFSGLPVSDVEKYIHIEIKESEQHRVEIKYTDNAGGIPQAILEKIWQPFFSTKVEGEGTGLGLSITQKIVHEHGGRILCSSQPPTTTFRIILPCTHVAKKDTLFLDDDEL